MYEKYRLAHFGRCPHVFCQGQPVLPVGLSDLPRNYTVNVFCPRCHGLFFPKSTRQANIDGAYFGTTFPHLYLMTHPVSTKSTVTNIYLSLLVPQSIYIYIPYLTALFLCVCIYTYKKGHGTLQAGSNVSATRLRVSGQRIERLLHQS